MYLHIQGKLVGNTATHNTAKYYLCETFLLLNFPQNLDKILSFVPYSGSFWQRHNQNRTIQHYPQQIPPLIKILYDCIAVV